MDFEEGIKRFLRTPLVFIQGAVISSFDLAKLATDGERCFVLWEALAPIGKVVKHTMSECTKSDVSGIL
jgi:hypothetical protein